MKFENIRDKCQMFFALRGILEQWTHVGTVCNYPNYPLGSFPLYQYKTT